MKNGEPSSQGGTFLTQEPRSILYHIHTLFLFTKSDIKTVVIPQSIFALATALSLHPSGSTTSASTYLPDLGVPSALAKLCRMQAWIWLHLLVHTVANQRLAASVAEDQANKPWRPLPAGRATRDEAQRLLRALVPLAMGGSLCLLGGAGPGAALLALVWLYNDLDAAGAGPCYRNLINAAGLACFGCGATSVLLRDARDEIPGEVRRWVALTAAVVATTIFAQDFPDMAGDRARGRRTVPLVYPETAARVALALLVLSWSLACLVFWDAVAGAWMGILGVGGAMAALTVCRRGQWCDEVVWKLWCLWISLIYLLPLFGKEAFPADLITLA
ncbi:UbiA prenyltransferase family-domain-containing protein [Biscogniauxia sp. FL1348]|nr:UbiA prenyltransferase family-domain-containing protein [Biscogniauxia sp. FL1348]